MPGLPQSERAQTKRAEPRRTSPASARSRGGVRVAPSILSADYARLADEVESVRSETDVLHIDVMDAHFVPNLTIGPPVVAWLRRHTDLYLDCHLMMDEPGRYLGAFRDAGADGCSVHVEVGRTGELLDEIRRLGLDAGLAVNPETPIETAFSWLGEVDLLLVMTVHPGFGGQGFIEEMVGKIATARRAIDDRGLAVELEVDGGIDPTTAPVVARAGARLLVAGSAIFGEADRVGATRRIREAATSALAPPGTSDRA